MECHNISVSEGKKIQFSKRKNKNIVLSLPVYELWKIIKQIEFFFEIFQE